MVVGKGSMGRGRGLQRKNNQRYLLKASLGCRPFPGRGEGVRIKGLCI